MSKWRACGVHVRDGTGRRWSDWCWARVGGGGGVRERSSGRGSEEEEEEERRKRMRVTEPERKSDSGEQRRTGKLMARDNEERGKRK